MPHVTVNVNGKSYRMACDEGQEEHLASLAARIDVAIEELKETFGEIGDQRLTVMASILMTDKLHEAEVQLRETQSSLDAMRAERDGIAREFQDAEAGFKDRIASLTADVEKLADALSGGSKQEERIHAHA